MNKDSITFTMYSSVVGLSMVSQSQHQRNLNAFTPWSMQLSNKSAKIIIVMSSKIPNYVSRQVT